MTCVFAPRGTGEMEFDAFAWKAEGDEGGGDFGRRVEGFGRNFEDEFGARVELAEDGKIAVIARAGLGRDAERDFGLNDDLNFVDDVGESEQAMEDGRSDVVGKVAVEIDAAAGGDGREIGSKNVAGDDVEFWILLREVAQAREELRVEFDGVDGSAGDKKVQGHFAVTGADFDPAMLVVPREWHGGMRGDANGARDLFAPVEIGEEVLAEALASHGWNSVTVEARVRCFPTG